MVDSIAAHVETHELGRLEERVPLEGSLEVEGEDLGAEVCRTHRGLWLVAADSVRGTAVDLVGENWSYETGRRTDILDVCGRRFSASGNTRQALRETLSIGRLRAGKPGTARPVLPSRYIAAPDAVERAALSGLSEAGEVVLAFVRTDARAPLASRRIDETDGAVYFVLTDERALELVLGSIGDRRIVVLDPAAIEVRDRRVDFGDALGVKAKPQDRFLEVLEALGTRGVERILAVARLNFVGRSGEDTALRAARGLLEEAARRGSALGVVGQYLVAAELGEPPASRPPLDAVVIDDPAEVYRLWRSFRFSVRAGYELLDALRTRGVDSTTLELHRALREAGPSEAEGTLGASIADVDFAEHALAAGERALGLAVLEKRLASLPPYAVGDVALDTTAAARAVRTRILELLVEARGQPDTPDVAALSELSKLEPLARDRMLALAEVAADGLRERAARVAALLSTGGLSPAEPAAPEPAPALPTEALEARVPSRVSRDREALLGALQVLVAATQQPDFEAVLDYCEPLTLETAPAAARALHAAARILGTAVPGCFVSRGRKDVGVRSFQEPVPFVLLGGRHLDPHADVALTEAELRFALGAEVAHLRFRHVRVSVDAVWEGALDKSRQGLDFALGVLPMLTGVRMAGRLGKVASQLEPETVRKAIRGATLLNESLQKARKSEPRPDDTGIAPSNERLIAAHRLTQLTADRAGLLVAGSLRAALRAMFLVRRDYAQALEEASRAGLGVFFEAKLKARELPFYDLCIRAGALIAFYLSDDYAELHRLMTPAEAAESPAGG